MSRQKLIAYPYIEEIKYREKIDPHQLNLILRSLEESSLRAILRGSEISNLYDKLNLGVVSSYNALASHVGTLFSYESVPNGNAFATAYDTVDVTNGGNQDRVAGIVTLDWDKNRRYSKIPRYDSDADNIPDTVSPNVEIWVDGTMRNTDDDAYNMLNRKNDSFWIEQTASGVHTVQVNIPPSLNKLFNYVEISPFPMFGNHITKVEYQNEQSQWETIYNEADQDYLFYSNSGPLVMHQTPKQTNGTFRITVDVADGIEAIGFSNFDVGLIDYKDEIQTFYMKFMNIPPRTSTTTYNLVTSQVDFYIHEAVKNDNFITEMAIVNSTDGSGDKVTINKITNSEYSFGNQSIDLDPDENLYLKVVMKEVNNTSPVFRGCYLTYEV